MFSLSSKTCVTCRGSGAKRLTSIVSLT